MPFHASSFNILLGKLWVHKRGKTPPNRLEQLPLFKLEPKNDIHGELSFAVQGRIVPFMGFVQSDDSPRDGVCFPEWISHLKKLVNTLLRKNQVSFSFKENDAMDGPFFEFVRETDKVFFSLSRPLGNSCFKAEPGWEMEEFKFHDLLLQFFKFKDDFLREIQKANYSLRDEWEAKFAKKKPESPQE
ncbi:hypothetical protein HYY75_12470 [bacterium]|nr:hypothetical protein [bacterium]